MKNCPFCAETIQDEAVICRFCQRDLPETGIGTDAVSAAGNGGLITQSRHRSWILWPLLFAAVVLAVFLLGNRRGHDGVISSPDRPQAYSGLTPTDNPANEMLLRASQSERARVLLGALETSGKPCETVVSTYYQGILEPTGAALWNVECAVGRSYAVLIMNDNGGSTRIMPCEQYHLTTGTKCFEPL